MTDVTAIGLFLIAVVSFGIGVYLIFDGLKGLLSSRQ